MNMLNSSRKKSPREYGLEKENCNNCSGSAVGLVSTSSCSKAYTPNLKKKRRNSRNSTTKSTAKKQKTTPMITKRMSIPNRPSRIHKRDSKSSSNNEHIEGFPSVEIVSDLCASMLLNSEKKSFATQQSGPKSRTPYCRRDFLQVRSGCDRNDVDVDSDDDFSPTFLSKRCRSRRYVHPSSSPGKNGSPYDLISPREDDDDDYDRYSPILEEVEESGSPSSSQSRRAHFRAMTRSSSKIDSTIVKHRKSASFSHSEDGRQQRPIICSRHVRSRSASLTDVLETLGVEGEKFIKPTRRLATEIIARGKKAGIKLLALDWDNTVLKVHTNGQWYGNSDELYNNVRPFFVYLIQAAQNFHIHVSIVTFSGQTRLITEVIQKIMSANSKKKQDEVAPEYSIRCCDDTWDGVEALKQYFPTHTDFEMHLGKLPHISSVLKECMKDHVMPSECLLIDDDKENIKVAREVNLPSIRFDPEDEMSLADSLCEIFEKIGCKKKDKK